MTNTMTPSEIADWLEKRGALFDEEAAATIRDLEARVNNQSEIIKRQAVSGVNTAERLKITTEALEEVRDGAGEVALIAIADQALTRIDEAA